MGAYVELLVLYVILFLSGSFPGLAAPEGPRAFSPAGELVRVFLYTLPSLALVWYLLLKHKPLKAWGIGPPGRKDLLPGLLAFPSLALTGFSIALVAPYLSEAPKVSGIAAPAAITGWIILVVSCVSTGYLEESFFRLYIIAKREELGLGPSGAALVSALLFSLCHVYEGPWGFLNAALAGTALAAVFLRYRSLHGIALAHGLYNVFAYILTALKL